MAVDFFFYLSRPLTFPSSQVSVRQVTSLLMGSVHVKSVLWAPTSQNRAGSCASPVVGVSWPSSMVPCLSGTVKLKVILCCLFVCFCFFCYIELPILALKVMVPWPLTCWRWILCIMSSWTTVYCFCFLFFSKIIQTFSKITKYHLQNNDKLIRFNWMLLICVSIFDFHRRHTKESFLMHLMHLRH